MAADDMTTQVARTSAAMVESPGHQPPYYMHCHSPPGLSTG